MSDKIGTVILIVLVIVALVMSLPAFFLVIENERIITTPCEELLEKKGTTFVPIPKRCEKGE